ncbi:hypothetical protein GFS24_18010 [Chitinophaga sp. SYP-B3965]|uniref:hypothetical protein n=1 Tax=Chitinophaga sp. SYP-B3965 TaxID=2663120 RepID=UPI001299D75F|nr:hypothetical protein [Chitinophaga sp. SYP-B3965]MRG47023.1 hypothetical protein [Chitinophaga sp. SYP-B3965]
MKQFLAVCALATGIMACNNSTDQKTETSASAADNTVKEAKPAGTINVAFSKKDKDTSTVTFNFTVDTLKYEKSFEDLPLMKGFADTAIYRILWDKPNSVWIGIIKANRDNRYYHGTQDGASLRILWVPSPPARIYEYIDKKLGLGDVIRQQPLVEKYKENFQSGLIISDFIVELKPSATVGTVDVYIKFGGAERTLNMPVYGGGKPYIQSYKKDDVFVGLQIDGELEEYYEVKVVEGRIGAKQLKSVVK